VDGSTSHVCQGLGKPVGTGTCSFTAEKAHNDVPRLLGALPSKPKSGSTSPDRLGSFLVSERSDIGQ